MKKDAKTTSVCSVLLIACLIGWLTALPIGAASSRSHSWYCAHVKGHLQPPPPTELSFIEELDGYYADRHHSDPDAQDKVIYLTFDVGYENGNVGKILDILKEQQAPGAFFVLSNVVTSAPDLVRRMLEEGHTVCNHTAHHKDMSRLGKEAFLSELQQLEALCLGSLGEAPAKYYRPPEGRFSEENLVWAKENGYKTVFWSFAYPDWDNDRQPSPEKAKKIILDNAHNGEVMLLHPTSATNAAILGEVLSELKEMGYRFGSLDELTGGASCGG